MEHFHWHLRLLSFDERTLKRTRSGSLCALKRPKPGRTGRFYRMSAQAARISQLFWRRFWEGAVRPRLYNRSSAAPAHSVYTRDPPPLPRGQSGPSLRWLVRRRGGGARGGEMAQTHVRAPLAPTSFTPVLLTINDANQRVRWLNIDILMIKSVWLPDYMKSIEGSACGIWH